MVRKDPRKFTIEEYIFLHKTFLKNPEDTKFFHRIKAKKGVGLDKSEIDHIKKRFVQWKETSSLMPETFKLTHPNL